MYTMRLMLHRWRESILRPEGATPEARRSRRGFSTLELSMTIAIMSMVMAAFYGAYNGFLRDVAFAEQLAEVERRSRPAINDLLIELRQAKPPSGSANGQPIELLTEDSIIFYSDRANVAGPERIMYEKTSCAVGLCELTKTVIFADAGSAYPNWTYDVAGGPDVTQTVLLRIPADVVLFTGRQIDGANVTDVASCDRLNVLGAGASPCRLDQVLVEIEVVPRAADTSIVPRNYEVIEEVQLRNANF